MISPGLAIAARTARHQAKICRVTYGSTADADVLESFATTLDAMAAEEQRRLDNEATEPRIESVRCAQCGAETLVRRPG